MGLINFVNSFSADEGSVAAKAARRWAPDSAELTVAVSPVMAPVLEELVGGFNDQRNADA